ncbi:MAG: Asp-tRNA(Asn)/Glu-tRNA(Gln) amidotransferase subunit GatB [Candidatus Gracilibacteria bacterium]
MPLSPVIGLEIHARINSKTKLFCRCLNEAVPELPNKNICPICTGHPGMLPKPNQDAIRLGVRAALAINCTINEFSKFDRKNYFYPDLPMGYQISQYDQPVAENGYIEIEKKDGTKKRIGIERLHLENDAGKLSHTSGGSLVDYNRAGAPLMEIVSRADMRSMEEASLYARIMQQTLRASGASEVDMEKGMMRFDVNISLRENEDAPFGTKVEIKNLNSFRSMERAIIFEIDRQTKMIEKGEKITQETRGWDDEKEITISQRSKEEAADYRYFPEPDIPPLTFTKEQIEEIRSELPELPHAKKERYLSSYDLEHDITAVLIADLELADFFEAVVEYTKEPKLSSSWIVSILLGFINEKKIHLKELPFGPKEMAMVVSMVKEQEISSLSGKEVLEKMIENGKDPKVLVSEMGLLQVSDTKAIEAFVDEVIKDFPAQADEFRGGKTTLLGFFVGQTMKKSGGSANPKIVGEIVQKKLS